MPKAKLGDTVKVHYTGKLKDGTVFDDSLKREPLEFKIGENRLIAGFENAVIGMAQGDWKTVNIPVHEAYGPHMKEMVVTVKKTELPKDMVPQIGQQLMISQDDSQKPIVVSVTNITETDVTLDANHPLAGTDLVFELKLMEIMPPGHDQGHKCSCCH